MRFSGFGLDHFIRFPYPYCYRSPIRHEPRTCGLACLDLVEQAIRYGAGGAIAGLIIEPMQGAGGQIPTPPGYLAGLKEICQRHDILLIFDECQTAFGRVGAMSAAEYYGVVPDMIVLSKGLGGGFPIGAVLAREDLRGFAYVEEHTTFGANPVAFAAALATIEVTLRLLAFRDVTEEVELARLKEDLTYMLVHDLRSPLTVLKGGLTLMGQAVGTGEREETASLLAMAHRNTDRILRMVNELLDIGKIESGRLSLRLEPVDVRTLLAEVAARLAPLAVPANITLEIDVAPDLPPEEQPRLFKKFQQAGSVGGRRVGTGLGLPFCKLAVEAHGGSIWVESEVGRGSTFVIALPAAPQRSTPGGG